MQDGGRRERRNEFAKFMISRKIQVPLIKYVNILLTSRKNLRE